MLHRTVLDFHDELINRHKSASLKETKSSGMHGQGNLSIIPPSNWCFQTNRQLMNGLRIASLDGHLSASLLTFMKAPGAQNIGQYFRHIQLIDSLLGRFPKGRLTPICLTLLCSIKSYQFAIRTQASDQLQSWITAGFITQRYELYVSDSLHDC